MRFFTREFPHKSWILVGVVHSETLIHTRIQDFGDLGNFFVLGLIPPTIKRKDTIKAKPNQI